ncbi:hypothetical protein TRFO_27051 [Tritrichomonas foetus]|uniref:Regulator of chromosome condensation n=1 Tax=Tritrichomonas foetus TaxID=1144522 RepID=A0A1J4K1I3_9EUKA|nr:hypothetical protein TRFO_27051 [Tritrichomonas foetus]|eukprot:OHT05247.1 hypothetical protein TRFO_27051 [Tritrichomonas foetus]
MGCDQSATFSAMDITLPSMFWPSKPPAHLKVCGTNEYAQLIASSNRSTQFERCICPPLSAEIDVNDLLSFSIYLGCAVYVTKSGQAFIKGCFKVFNKDPQEVKFSELPDEKFKCAVTGYDYILYLTENDSIVFQHRKLEGDHIIFTLENERKPVSLFGGKEYCVVIDNAGDMYLFSRQTVLTKEYNFIHMNEPAKMVACCRERMFVLSTNGKVFWRKNFTDSYDNLNSSFNSLSFNSSSISSTINVDSGLLIDYSEEENSGFIEVDGLQDIIIKSISGIYDHCVAISSDATAYGIGNELSHKFGHEPLVSNEKFVKISTMEGKRINYASAGTDHTLFITEKGELFACGRNDSGNLFQEEIGEGEETIVPVQVVFGDDDEITYAVAGENLSAAFLNCDPPIYGPNKALL